MKQKYIVRYTKRKGFSLLELLVVVAIMAIIGGAVITAYDGLVSQSQKATATNTIGSLTNSVRQFKVVEGNYPNNWESLMSAVPVSTAVYDDSTGDSVITVGQVYQTSVADPLSTPANPLPDIVTTLTPTDVGYGDPLNLVLTSGVNATNAVGSTGVAGILASKLAGKFDFATPLTAAQAESLVEAGITKVRYTHADADDEIASTLSGIFTAGNEATPNVGPLSEISIPQHAFEAPRAGANRNRGRGFVLQFGADSTNVPAAIWDAGTGGYNNIKVGANPNAVLVGLGIGNANTLVDSSGNAGDQSAAVGSISLATAPFYGDVAKNSYQHYIALFDVSQSPAVFVAIVDSRGDFLDEEFAESTGQKK